MALVTVTQLTVTERSMPTPVSPEVAVLDERDASAQQLPDFTTESYKDSYSRINAIVIEGEKEVAPTDVMYGHAAGNDGL